MPPTPPELDAAALAVRAALLLGAPAAAVVWQGRILGHHGLTGPDLVDLDAWLMHDPQSARPFHGVLRRIARAAWPGDADVEVWVFGSEVRRLPGMAYDVLHAFLIEVAAA